MQLPKLLLHQKLTDTIAIKLPGVWLVPGTRQANKPRSRQVMGQQLVKNTEDQVISMICRVAGRYC